jgi:PAS domain S-box-containing protein
MTDLQEFVRRQRVLAEFGEFVLDRDDLLEILQEGCRLIAEALGADLAKVIEIDRATNTGLVRAGVGWRPGVVGHERIDLGERSSEAYAIETARPVVTGDIAREQRFDFPPFMQEHGVVALINVPILLSGRKPYGVLEVDAREPRAFDEEDVRFLMTYAMVLGPVVDRLQTVVELQETDQRLRLLVENARDYVVVLSDAEDRVTDWLGGSAKILGWSVAEAMGQAVEMIFTPEDREAGVPQKELASAREHGASPNVRWHRRKDGGRVFLDGQTIALRDAEGGLRGYLKIGQDVTERHRNAERQSVLLAELQHRVRNVLAMVRSIVRRTVAGGITIEQVGEQLEGRIDALARTQALLTRAVSGGVDLEALVRDELTVQAADGGGLSVAGPQVRLASKAAEILTLAVHELATNSIKYGALGQAGAILRVSWRHEDRDGVAWLRFEWRETGVTMADSAPRRRGFGTELITRRVPYELNGAGRIDYGGGEVYCAIDLPLVPGESILQTDSPV